MQYVLSRVPEGGREPDSWAQTHTNQMVMRSTVRLSVWITTCTQSKGKKKKKKRN